MRQTSFIVSRCIAVLPFLLLWMHHQEFTQQLIGQFNTVDTKINSTAKDLSSKTLSPPFSPNVMLQQYIGWHSESTMLSHPQIERQYALIYYYCPNRAGNILHSMFNSVIWAIIHNRTILWKYDTDFSDPNTVEDCQTILKRADWIPSWDKWAPILNLTEPVPISLNPLQVKDYQHYQTVVFPLIPDQMSQHTQFVRVDWRDDPMHQRRHREYISALDYDAIRTAGMLYRYGVDYLLGMLFQELFTIQVPISIQSNTNDFTVALHSRHTVVGDDGSFITDETQCLEMLLNNRPSTAKCVVYLMSDRPTTVQKLKEWLRNYNCTGVSTEDYTSIASSPLQFHDEHGPNPGTGFIRDLAFVSQARSAIVGDPGRSSFMLLLEIIEYNRRIDDWRLGRESPETIPLCKLPGRYGKGYNYGPGTPHFIAHWRNEPLKPVQVLKQYKAYHSKEALTNDNVDLSNRSFIIGYVPCPMIDSGEGLSGFLNDFLRAVVTNQTLLWKYSDDSTCQLQEKEKAFTRPCPSLLCNPNNNKLHIQSWLPSYDEWSESFHLNASLSSSRSHLNHTLPYVIHPMESNELVTTVSMANPEILDSLYEEGIDYLYGLLFHESIQLGSWFNNALNEDASPSNPQAIRVLAWHMNVKDNSSLFSEDNVSCLESMLSNTSKPCEVVSVMDNRDISYTKNLVQYFPHCSITTIEYAQEEQQKQQFWQLLHLARDPTWSVLVGFLEPSWEARFLLESLVYHRREVVWKLGRIPPAVPELVVC